MEESVSRSAVNSHGKDLRPMEDFSCEKKTRFGASKDLTRREEKGMCFELGALLVRAIF